MEITNEVEEECHWKHEEVIWGSNLDTGISVNLLVHF